MTDQSSTEHPTTIYAEGPADAAPQAVVRRQFETNEAAADAKSRESIAAQMAPNPTTDIDEARKAYGEDWNRRRGQGREIGRTAAGEPLYNHGGVAVDTAGHALGHASDPESAVAAKEGLGTDGELGRYPVTAEAQAEELRRANEDGTAAAEAKTLEGGLGSAVDTDKQAEHDEQVTSSTKSTRSTKRS